MTTTRQRHSAKFKARVALEVTTGLRRSELLPLRRGMQQQRIKPLQQILRSRAPS
jgi:hypothetical protein